MKVRDFKHSDIESIDRIWQKHHSSDFSVPDRKNMIAEAVVEDVDGNVVAYGQVKLFAEAMIILDKDASRREKVLALELLLAHAFAGANQARLNQMYAFIKDPDFALLLEKHFGFERAIDTGERLLWQG